MKDSTDDEEDLDDMALFDAQEEYDQYIEDNIGLSLKRKPSDKQKAAIVNQLKASFRKENDHDSEGDFDCEALFEKYAIDCIEPLSISDENLFHSCEQILVAFLPDNHPRAQELWSSDDEPSLNIKQLLKKPSVQQVAQIISALRIQRPEWRLNNGPSAHALLASGLGYTFPELIKQTATARNFFGENVKGQSSASRPKNKKKKNSKGFLTYVILAFFLVLLWLLMPSRPSAESAESSQDESAKSKEPLEKTVDLYAAEAAKDLPLLSSLEGVSLPITLISTEEFALLDKTGKQATITAGSIVTVESRAESGTLTIRINGELFVGNEKRLAGKAKVKAD